MLRIILHQITLRGIVINSESMLNVTQSSFTNILLVGYINISVFSLRTICFIRLCTSTMSREPFPHFLLMMQCFLWKLTSCALILLYIWKKGKSSLITDSPELAVSLKWFPNTVCTIENSAYNNKHIARKLQNYFACLLRTSQFCYAKWLWTVVLSTRLCDRE